MLGTCTVIVGMIAIYMAGIKHSEKQNILCIENVNTLKFAFSIIVLFVHVPQEYQNTLQDLVGSFAYIGVSWFCMISAYGLKCKCICTDYIDHFKYRFTNVLAPLLVGGAVDLALNVLHCKNTFSFIEYDHVYGWIRILLLFYLEFFAVYALLTGHIKYQVIDWLLCVIIIVQSIFDYFYGKGIFSGWYIERIGFVTGIIIYDNKKHIDSIVRTHKRMVYVIFALTVASGTIYLKYKYLGFFGGYLLRSILEITFLLLLVTATTKWKFTNVILNWGAGISYEIYIMHPIVFSILENTLPPKYNEWFVFIATIGTLFAAQVLSVLLISLGMKRRIKKIK